MTSSALNSQYLVLMGSNCTRDRKSCPKNHRHHQPPKREADRSAKTHSSRLLPLLRGVRQPLHCANSGQLCFLRDGRLVGGHGRGGVEREGSDEGVEGGEGEGEVGKDAVGGRRLV